MKDMTSRSSLLVALTLTLTATSALAQVQPVEGQLVRAHDGVVLGQVQRVVTDPAGRPTQVLVQPKAQRPWRRTACLSKV